MRNWLEFREPAVCFEMRRLRRRIAAVARHPAVAWNPRDAVF
jgi:hypothetical protein